MTRRDATAASSRSSGSRRSRCCSCRRSCSSRRSRRGPSGGTRPRSRRAKPRGTCSSTGPHGDRRRRPSSSPATSPPITGSRASDVSVRVLAVGASPGDQIRVEVRVRDAGDRGARPRAGRRVDLLDGRVVACRRLPEPVMRGRAAARDQHGMITLWILGLTIAVMFLGGLGLDLWRAIAVRREVSMMADAAATAGANGLDENALRGDALQLDDAAGPAARRGRARGVSRTRAGSTAMTSTVAGVRVNVSLREHGAFLAARHLHGRRPVHRAGDRDGRAARGPLTGDFSRELTGIPPARGVRRRRQS